jgi:integrase
VQDASSQKQLASRPLERLVNKKGERRDPGIFKRGNGFVVIYRDGSGRQRKAAAKTLAEARTIRANRLSAVARGEHFEASTILFRDYARTWVKTYTGRASRWLLEETRADYEKRLEADAIPFLGAMRMSAIQARHVREFVSHVAARGVSRGTVRLALAPVKALFAQVVEDGAILSNPAASVRVVVDREEFDSDGNPLEERVKALTEDELGALLGKIPDRWRTFYAFLAETGLRIGEAIELRWRDVDLGRRRIRVERQFYRGSVRRPKSRYGVRDVPLTETMAKELWRLRAGASEDALVFPAERGGRIDQSNLMSRILKPAAKAAGISGEVGHHTLRHLAGSRWFAAGWNAKQVQLALGHHSAAFTLAVYVHALDDDLPEPVAAPTGRNNGATESTETARNDDGDEGLREAV